MGVSQMLLTVDNQRSFRSNFSVDDNDMVFFDNMPKRYKFTEKRKIC